MGKYLHQNSIINNNGSIQITQKDIQDTCSKYGAVDVVTLRTKVVNGIKASRGLVIVQFSTKEGACKALKNLVFEDSLGDPGRLNISFYESKESRALKVEQEEQERQMRLAAAAINVEPMNGLVWD